MILEELHKVSPYTTEKVYVLPSWFSNFLTVYVPCRLLTLMVGLICYSTSSSYDKADHRAMGSAIKKIDFSSIKYVAIPVCSA